MREAVLFDLDGTLADTLLDLLGALNAMRTLRALAPVPAEAIRAIASQGSGVMIKQYIPDCEAASLLKLREEFFQHYLARKHQASSLFAGIPELLAEIEQRQIPWGIVTNKNTMLTKDLLPHLDVDQRISTLICGDTMARAKPDPSGLREACSQTGADPANSLFLGDDRCDFEAAAACGMPFAAVRWSGLWQHQATIEVDHPHEIVALL